LSYDTSLFRPIYIDLVNTVSKALEAADGLIVGSAVHFASATGAITSFMDRLFYCGFNRYKMKFGACTVSCRRGGEATILADESLVF